MQSAFERAYVDALLERHKGNISQGADAAELSRQHMYVLISTNAKPDSSGEPEDDGSP